MTPAQQLSPNMGRWLPGGKTLAAIKRDRGQLGQKTDEFGIIDNGDCRVEFTRRDPGKTISSPIPVFLPFVRKDAIMKTTTRFVSQRTLFVPLILAIAGCYQPYYQTPYGPYQSAPYGAQPAPYGAPTYGTPAPMGAPYGGGVPTGSLPPSTISSMPGDTYYSPPSGNNAPPFGAQPAQPAQPSNGNSVPRYNDPTSSNNSPYFEKQSSFRPEAANDSGMVAQAGFAAEEPQSAAVEQTSAELFEPPIVTSRSQTPVETPAASQPKPAEGPFELEAPPLGDPKSSADNSLEGVVRRNPQTGGLTLEFAPGPEGQMQLTGSQDVLKGFQEGSRYRVQGFIEAAASPNMQNKFHVQRYEPLNAPAANSPPATFSPFDIPR